MKKTIVPLTFLVLCIFLPALAAQDWTASGPTITVAHAPFQGERVGRTVRELADGTTIIHEEKGRIARDSDGRVYEEQQQTAVFGDKALPTGPMHAAVIDPVKHFQMRWESSPKIVTVSPISTGELHVGFPPWFPKLAKTEGPLPVLGAKPDSVTTEDLGKKTLSGIVTTGTRTTTVIPIGKLGNDRTLTIVHDTWFSKDLDLPILEIITDPRFGRENLEIRGITRAEPDPALFRAPQGYQIQTLADILKGRVAGGVAPIPEH
ncbi:MAG TPA: hypothetical protein VIH72_04310 [Candidatus Acidoferrales bacterium]|jgi:hypothetical protein